VQFTGPLYLCDLIANDDATPVVMIGSASDVRIAGGDFLQTNGRAVQVGSLTKLAFVAGTTSHDGQLSAQNNRAVFEQNGADVTARVIVNP
jgi:hypothetical protein